MTAKKITHPASPETEPVSSSTPAGSTADLLVPPVASVAEQVFVPSPYQQQLKAQFWSRYEPGPFGDRRSVSFVDIQELTPDPKLKQFWGLPGFKAWFLNQDEVREKIEYLFNLASSAMEGLLLDPSANANAKVNIFKYLAEMTGRLNKGGMAPEKFSDESVNKMSEEELKNWLKRKGVTVKAQYQVRPGIANEEPEVFNPAGVLEIMPSL